MTYQFKDLTPEPKPTEPADKAPPATFANTNLYPRRDVEDLVHAISQNLKFINQYLEFEVDTDCACMHAERAHENSTRLFIELRIRHAEGDR